MKWWDRLVEQESENNHLFDHIGVRNPAARVMATFVVAGILLIVLGLAMI